MAERIKRIAAIEGLPNQAILRMAINRGLPKLESLFNGEAELEPEPTIKIKQP